MPTRVSYSAFTQYPVNCHLTTFLTPPWTTKVRVMGNVLGVIFLTWIPRIWILWSLLLESSPLEYFIIPPLYDFSLNPYKPHGLFCAFFSFLNLLLKMNISGGPSSPPPGTLSLPMQSSTILSSLVKYGLMSPKSESPGHHSASAWDLWI